VNGAIGWFARNSVAANLAVILILAAGLLTLPTITQKNFPDVEVKVITIRVPYLGAAPDEVERGVCMRVEESLDGVEGIEKIFSSASEGSCTVRVELLEGADVAKALDDVKNRVDAIDTFPEETEKPIIAQVAVRRSVIDVAIAGRADERSLKALGERVRDQISTLPGVTQAELTNARPYEISIEVSEETLRRHGLTFDQVAAAVRRTSLDIPGGSIKTAGGEILLRTQGQAYHGPEFERIVVLKRPDGTRVTLDEIARVVDGFEDSDQRAEFDGQPAVMVRVFRVGDQDAIEIAQEVKAWVERERERMPEGIDLVVWRDDTESLRDRIDIMLRSGVEGFALVLIVLALFLRPRVAAWVSLSVPISMLGTIWLMPALGQSINVMSTFAFILVIGILVDDAVVVGENIFTRQQRAGGGGDPLESAIAGAREVATPVIFGVLSSICAFVPLMFSGGESNQVFGVLATIVITALTFSLIESQLFLPSRLANIPRGSERPRTRIMRLWYGLEERFSRGFERFSQERYRGWLVRALDWRYATIAAGICALLWTIGLVASGRMRFSYFPFIESNYASAELTMPTGTPIESTEAAVRQIEAAARQLRAELDQEYGADGRSLIEHVMVSIGEQPSRASQGQQPGARSQSAFVGSHLGEVSIELVRSEERPIRTRDVAARWRELTGAVPEAVELEFTSAFFSFGDPISVQLRGDRVEDLREASARLRAALGEYPGVIDISDSFRAGKRELELSILPGAEALGLSLGDLGRQVRQAFYGEEVQRIQRGREDIRVMVRYPESERRSLGDLENLRIRAADGVEVPFSSVALAEQGRGYASIQRSNRQRVIDVTADVDEQVTTANEVIASVEVDVLPGILADYSGMSYSLEGQQREQTETVASLLRASAIAQLTIYALLAIPLRSYGLPLLIMSVIPFGFVGAVLGHVLLRQNLSILSFMGVLTASGVVVNASLVLVHRVAQLRAEGVGRYESVLESGLSRIRPIALTSATTFAGLLPVLTNRSFTAQFLIPMATSLAFGVAFTTLITLFLVPALYLAADDVGDLWRRRRARGGAQVVELERARAARQ
jgi:multidrug efflux pump subunit AcrB